MTEYNKYLTKRALGCLCLVFSLIFSNDLKGQSIGNIMPGFKSTVSFAGSYGGTFDGKGQLWGFSADYTTLIKQQWMFSSSVAFDQETTQMENSPNDIANTVSLQFAGGHLINKRVSVGAGFAKGLMGSNSTEKWKLKDFGKDWTVGILGNYTFYINGPHSFDIASSLEYRINEKKASYSFDIGYGFSF